MFNLLESIDKIAANLKSAETDLSRRQKDEKQAYRELIQIRQAREEVKKIQKHYDDMKNYNGD